jgi:RNA polymerase sigma factor (sigma-70 family)
MAARQSGIVLGQIRTLFNQGRIGTMSDEQLLEQFAVRRAEAVEASQAAECAFEAIVIRHGPMVLAVCRRVLRDPHEVEDAFQATFLILARRAGSIRKRGVLGGWLRKVALRVSARAKALSVRSIALDASEPVSSADEPGTIVERDDLRVAVLDEVQLLPEKYRLPVQLCYIEGQTHDEAARRLAWPVGTVRTRLTWARDRLRARLTRRGLALPAGFIGASMVSLKARAEVPGPLIKATVQTVTGRAGATAVASLAANVSKGMLMSQLKIAIALILAGGALAGLALPPTGAQARKNDAAGQARHEPPATTQAQGQNEPPTDREVGTVFFRVVDKATKQPLPAVSLKVWINGKVDREHITDDSGRFTFRLPEKVPGRFAITARRDGLVPMRVSLRSIAARETEIPRSYTIAMEPGTSIGGIVRDEEGRPIEGVTVTFYDNSPDDSGREAFDFRTITARTDGQGRWRVDLIPAGFDLGRLHFTFSHPEFLSQVDAVNNQPIATPKELRSQGGVSVLRRGIAVSGRVLDRNGRPIGGASVRLGGRSGTVDVATDAIGHFLVRNATARETVVTAQAAGYAPEMQPLKVKAGLPPIEFRLGPGNPIRGRVVDSQGQPIVRAGVSVLNWKGYQALNWQTETDALGRFRWSDAPSDEVSLFANKAGYSSTQFNLKPSDQEHVLTLARVLVLRGTVVDAQTGRPISTFTLVPGVRATWIPVLGKIIHGGRYERPFDDLGSERQRIRIEAKGYRPAVSPFYENDAGEQVFDVRLEKGDWVTGAVRGQRGEPLSGAEVIVAGFPGLQISGGKAYQRNFHSHTVTDAGGQFAFSPPEGPYRLVALHNQGYAEASAEQVAGSHGLTLAPWGRIEGTLRVGGKPLAHQTIVATLDDQRIDLGGIPLQNDSRAQTDEQGRFVMERVVPGEARVHWQPDHSTGRKTLDRYYQAPFRTVGPGQTVPVDLAQEGGRPLVGWIAAGDPAAGQLDLARGSAYLLLRAPEVPYPPGLSEPDRREWLRQWRFTEEARAYRQVRRGFAHTLELKPDGSFRVDEVQPGAYQLHVRVKGFDDLIRDFEVPEAADGQNGAPVDLGPLVLKRS